MNDFRKYQWKFIAVLISILFLGITGGFIWPTLNDALDKRNARDTLQNRITGAMEWEQRMDQIEGEKSAINAFFDDISSEMPDDYLKSAVIERMFEIAQSTGVSIQRLEPLDTTITDTYVSTPFQLQVTGSYHNLIRLMNGLEQMGYWLKPESITIRSERNPSTSDLQAIVQISIIKLTT
ncbi:MAG: hypothetical protein EA391_05445 [Balneolaceae bacterium]|nr:MAG: hypothetical protein EA391_05445 [Balneolaceae bacterium]